MITLKIGDKAPDFSAKDQNGNDFSLHQLLGKKVVLFFYPKDNTPGCTAEACDLRDNYAQLQSQGFEVVGVSIDSEKSHQKFIEKHQLPYTLIADTEKEVVSLYGVWQEKSMYGRKYMGTVRTTFLIDEKGIITAIIEKVKTNNHTAQILA